MLIATALAASLLAQSGSSSTGEAPRPNVPKIAEASHSPKRVCVDQVATGSILPRQVCHSSDEWKALEREQLEASRGSGPIVPAVALAPVH